ncbi:Basic region leucine zipper [Popillia japonica]|uniref:Basic region leucine zipper n=1 Tax=Popillia japonica TaxID=7064 RepID=A0AAW1KXZ0_POPJA
MDYTPPILDLSTRTRCLPDLVVFEPRVPLLEHQISPSNTYASLNTNVDFCDGASSSSSSCTSPKQNRNLKLPRPFKAYPKDPLSVAVSVATADTILGQDSGEAYAEFRKRMLSQAQSACTTTNKNMRRYSQTGSSPNNDPSYWEKRRKNNEAAKRSRDARRAKEDEIAIRCAFLEQENLKLRYESATLRDEVERLRNLVYK